MASSPPESPQVSLPRPASAMMKGVPRSNSRMSMSSKTGGSRASDEDGKTAVKVGKEVLMDFVCAAHNANMSYFYSCAS